MEISTYVQENINTITIVVFCVSILMVLWCILSWYALKWFKINILDNEIYYYNKYSEKEEKLIKEYGDLKVTRMYLILQPISIVGYIVGSIITSREFVNKLKMEHACVMLEMKMKSGEIKRVFIDKTCRLEVKLNYVMHSQQNVIQIKMKKNKYTMNEILEKTKEYMGVEKYYNYHYSNNNCHDLAVGVLKSIKCCDDDIEKLIRRNYYSKGANSFTSSFSELGVHIFSFILSIMYQIDNFYNFMIYINWRVRTALRYGYNKKG